MTTDLQRLAKMTIWAFADIDYKKPRGRWEAMFNPTELSFSRSNEYERQRPSGGAKAVWQYTGGEAREVSIEFFFDGTGVVESTQSVRKRVESFEDITSYHGDTHQPWYLQLMWGGFRFSGIRTTADISYTLFDREGEPLRAKLKATFREALSPEENTRDERNESPDLYQTWQVAQGERLDTIAAEIYGDPAWWRPLAEVNGLNNALDLAPGTILVLPPQAP